MSAQNELDRWTRQVRLATQRDMGRLRDERVSEATHAVTFTKSMRTMRLRLLDIRAVTRNGWPAIERYIMGVISPKLAPERLLPDA